MSANPATWSSERVALLKSCFDAGFSCSQIAREIGVTRNAVIGKLSRLGLSRPKDAIAAHGPQRAAGPARPSRTWRPKLNIFAQRGMLQSAFPGTQAEPAATPYHAVEIPVQNGRGCTLFELTAEKCRWPISTPGADDFCFCGNEPVKGLPYCLGHARLAYRPAGRSRSSSAA